MNKQLNVHIIESMVTSLNDKKNVEKIIIFES